MQCIQRGKGHMLDVYKLVSLLSGQSGTILFLGEERADLSACCAAYHLGYWQKQCSGREAVLELCSALLAPGKMDSSWEMVVCAFILVVQKMLSGMQFRTHACRTYCTRHPDCTKWPSSFSHDPIMTLFSLHHAELRNPSSSRLEHIHCWSPRI